MEVTIPSLSTDHLFSYSDYNAGPIADLPSSTAASYAPLPSTGQNTTKCQLMQAVPPVGPNSSYTLFPTDYGGRYSGMYASTGFYIVSIM